jgi:hypothetical protein
MASAVSLHTARLGWLTGNMQVGDVPGFRSTLPCQMQMGLCQSMTESALESLAYVVPTAWLRGLYLVGDSLSKTGRSMWMHDERA